MCVPQQAPLFTDKANLFPEAVFVVGYDTAVRLVDERYYSSHDPMAVQVITTNRIFMHLRPAVFDSRCGLDSVPCG